jgi:hypothetical protein
VRIAASTLGLKGPLCDPDAVEVFRSLFEGSDVFERFTPIPVKGLGHITLKVLSGSSSSAIVVFQVNGRSACVCGFASGQESSEDRDMLASLQSSQITILREHGIEPAFDLLAIDERPLAVSIPTPDESIPLRDRMMIGDMSRCAAAGYFLGILES